MLIEKYKKGGQGREEGGRGDRRDMWTSGFWKVLEKDEKKKRRKQYRCGIEQRSGAPDGKQKYSRKTWRVHLKNYY